MTAGFWKFVRFACYCALVLALAALAALIVPFAFEYCKDGGAGQIVCEPSVLKQIFETGFAIVMFGAYTGFPAALAAGGVFFLLRDLTSMVRS